ncbi:hypothetical protein [Salinicola rhizosphaerae]|uniref:Uncharacterized protein n=1 Tax=Salinicola rhizosphaerae TaxID=1443141 RepID=A0ABQ3DV56_9GAMM|nr:hypothetical protein [Salinicola rhizosphaerae]GHB12899.1 hypothetical protein GCM10009038_08660 [Salinicola rhizosphaerae]
MKTILLATLPFLAFALLLAFTTFTPALSIALGLTLVCGATASIPKLADFLTEIF